MEVSGKSRKAHLLLFTFAEFNAQVVLEASHEILVFKWNPTNPNQLAAGCTTGQVLFYDLTTALETILRRSRGKQRAGKADKNEDKAIVVPPASVSTIDYSHGRPVADLAWLPPSHHVST